MELLDGYLFFHYSYRLRGIESAVLRLTLEDLLPNSMKKKLSSSRFLVETTERNFFPYLFVNRKIDNQDNRIKSAKIGTPIFSSPHVGIDLLLCERTSELRTDVFFSSCFSFENIMKGFENRFRSGNFIKISSNTSERKGNRHDDTVEKNEKNKRDLRECSLQKELLMCQSQNTTHYLVESTQALKNRNISDNRELPENGITSSELFRFISSDNDGFLTRTNAISILAFSLSSLAAAVAGEKDVWFSVPVYGGGGACVSLFHFFN